MYINIENHLKRVLNPIILEDLLEIGSAHLPWGELDGKTVLITGGSGFLASYIVQSLLVVKRLYGLNIKVNCIVRNLNSVKTRLQAWGHEPDLQFFCHDISAPLADDFPVADFIIHSASHASPKYYGSDPVGTLLANSVGTKNLLDYSAKEGVKNFLFFSSGEVYGAPLSDGGLITENDYGYLDPMSIRSCYAESKRIGETMCVSWAHQYGLHINVVRPFHTYGPGMSLDDGRVFSDFVADIVKRRNIKLKSDGLARRPFCYIADATLGFLTVLLKGLPSQAYNVANPEAEISMKDLANVLSQLFPEREIGVQFDVESKDDIYLKSPILRQCPSVEKISKLGWFPKVNIEDGFRRTIQSYIG
jgi:nucleoside-diphosphate-sugar epimerase